MNIFKLFKKKRPRELGDLDNLSLSNVDKIVFQNSSMKNLDEIIRRDSLCPKCESNFHVVEPMIYLGKLILCECDNCHERFYKGT